MAAASTACWSSPLTRKGGTRKAGDARLGRVLAARQEARREPGRDERIDQRVDMAAVLRFDDNIELGALDRSVVKQALMVHLDDVGTQPADNPGDPRQDTRQIGQFGA